MSTANLFERRWLPSDLDVQREIVEALRARGAKWIRLSLKTTGEMIGEGWFVRPGYEGELPQ